MRWTIAAASLAGSMIALSSRGDTRSLLHDPVALNIGVNCQWQARCMVLQHAAMQRSLTYVATARPAQWRVQLCNRNAARGGYRVDWIGYDHCIRNRTLKRPSRSGRR
ncbi:MAG TPA: hypothetical protein VJ846_00380 [Sphingomicrobium sp.]|nr:hypothetical protein [Sphingomicrobium sp.]